MPDVCKTCGQPRLPAAADAASRVLAEAHRLFGASPADLAGYGGRTYYSRPRRLTALALRRCGMTLPDIGARLNRDHSTIVSAIRVAEGLVASDDRAAAELACLVAAAKLGRAGETAEEVACG